MLDASALLVVQPVTTVSVPAKLYEYMAAGRPVLALAEPGGETANTIQRSGAGIAVSHDDESAIHGALVSMVAGGAGFKPVHRTFFDGELRAEEIRLMMSDVVARRSFAPPPGNLDVAAGAGDVEVMRG
jgi:hypothetical protein